MVSSISSSHRAPNAYWLYCVFNGYQIWHSQSECGVSNAHGAHSPEYVQLFDDEKRPFIIHNKSNMLLNISLNLMFIITVMLLMLFVYECVIFAGAITWDVVLCDEWAEFNVWPVEHVRWIWIPLDGIGRQQFVLLVWFVVKSWLLGSGLQGLGTPTNMNIPIKWSWLYRDTGNHTFSELVETGRTRDSL